MEEQLVTAIDTLLALDVDGLSDGELHDVVVAVQRQSHRLAAVRAKLVGAWDRRRCWTDDGSRSSAHRLSREANTSIGCGRREVARARALPAMPATLAALADGTICVEHVDLLAGANTARRAELFARDEDVLVAQCGRLRFAQATRMIEYWKRKADAVGCEDDAERRREGRCATAASTIDGMVHLNAWLDPIGGAEVKAELDRLTEIERLKDQRDGRVRTGGQRRADALVEMAQRSRRAAEGGLRPRPLLTVLLGAESFSELCELADGTVVTPGQLVPLLGEADIERVMFDGPDRVISVSRKRSFTGALRRAIEVRDRRCKHPSGCDEPAARCDIDHRVPWSHGGMTSQDNGELRCWPHNRIEAVRNARPDGHACHTSRAPPDTG